MSGLLQSRNQVEELLKGATYSKVATEEVRPEVELHAMRLRKSAETLREIAEELRIRLKAVLRAPAEEGNVLASGTPATPLAQHLNDTGSILWHTDAVLRDILARLEL